MNIGRLFVVARTLIRKVIPSQVRRRIHRALRLNHRSTRRFYPEFTQLYGDFSLGEYYEDQAIFGVEKESGAIRGSIVHFVDMLPTPERVFLPGEVNLNKRTYADMIGVQPGQITTAGVLDDMDFHWDFEQDPPEMGLFDLSITQAMLEHLIDPYRHVRDIARLTKPGGSMILLTVMPGYKYHRYPVDCFRFWPDWFEEVADRLQLKVQHRYLDDLRIVYVLQRPLEETG